jgi:hypothetical protein
VDEATEPVATADLAHERSVSSLVGRGRPELERTMRLLAVVVIDVDAEHVFEVAPVEDQQPVETPGTYGDHHTVKRSKSSFAGKT